MLESTITTQKSRRGGARELREALRKQLVNGEFEPDAQLPSFAEMRRQGYGQATVERAYEMLVEEGLIRREPGRGVFANLIRRQRTGNIGFIGTNYAQRQYLPYSELLVSGIESVVQREERRILLMPEGSAHDWGQVDGVLISAWNARAVARSLPPELPHVSLLIAPEGVPSVVADDHGGARDGIERLIALGHRRIACLLQHTVTANWENLPGLVDSLAFGRLRLGGYFEALQKAGIELNPALVRDPGPPRHEGYRAWGNAQVTRWLEEDWYHLGATALFAQNDMAAIGAIQAFQAAGLRVPQDVSVLSFDGTEVCEFSSPTVAAVQVPLTQVGATAMEVLLEQMKSGRIEPSTTVLKTRFKAGQSIAPPAAKTGSV